MGLPPGLTEPPGPAAALGWAAAGGPEVTAPTPSTRRRGSPSLLPHLCTPLAPLYLSSPHLSLMKIRGNTSAKVRRVVVQDSQDSLTYHFDDPEHPPNVGLRITVNPAGTSSGEGTNQAPVTSVDAPRVDPANASGLSDPTGPAGGSTTRHTRVTIPACASARVALVRKNTTGKRKCCLSAGPLPSIEEDEDDAFQDLPAGVLH